MSQSTVYEHSAADAETLISHVDHWMVGTACKLHTPLVHVRVETLLAWFEQRKSGFPAQAPSCLSIVRAKKKSKAPSTTLCFSRTTTSTREMGTIQNPFMMVGFSLQIWWLIPMNKPLNVIMFEQKLNNGSWLRAWQVRVMGSQYCQQWPKMRVFQRFL